MIAFDKELQSMHALKLLLYNYSPAQKNEMCENEEVAYVWSEKLDLKRSTYEQLLLIFFDLGYKVQRHLLNVADKYYGKEANRAYENAKITNAMLFAELT